MPPRSTKLWIAKWTGLAVSVLLAGGWGSSHLYQLQAGVGAVSVETVPGGIRFLQAEKSWITGFGASIQDAPEIASIWWPSAEPFDYTWGCLHSWTTVKGQAVAAPFWPVLVMACCPTIIWWRRDRRPKPGHCPCGYDLTGNVSGRCPECWEQI